MRIIKMKLIRNAKIKTAEKDILIRYRINLKTGQLEVKALEDHNPDHDGLERLSGSASGKIVNNEPSDTDMVTKTLQKPVEIEDSQVQVL